MNDEEFLAHYGVRGMKWGVRRANRAAQKKLNSKPSDEGRQAAEIRTKQKTYGTSSLTNQELKLINERARLEIEFNRNFPKPTTKLQKGQKAVKEILGYAKTADEAYTFVNKVQDRHKKAKQAKQYAEKVAQGEKLMELLVRKS